MNRVYKKPFWQTLGFVVILALLAGGSLVLQQPVVWDFFRGLSYEPDTKIAEIETELNLTKTGRRIFRAVKPSLEGKEDFNSHCTNANREVSLLGCYTGGQIYVYEVTAEQLEMANKVTMAHELLHAVWERLSDKERAEITALLEEVYAANKGWFDEELTAYAESERIEEMYARAGTKLSELPEKLEEHYAKFFERRAEIVQAYEIYEAPFLALKLELEQLATKIEQTAQEIEMARKGYLSAVSELDAEIERFNACADQAGCFLSESVFNQRRNALVAKKESLENTRIQLNDKITENNVRIEDYRARQAILGELNEAMDSRLNEMEVLEERN